MPACTVCAHPERVKIDQALAAGQSARGLAAAHGLAKDALNRHKANHLSAALKAVATRRQTEGARRAVDRLEELHERASRVLEAAERDGSASVSLAALKELRGIVMDLARLTGELDERPTVQVLNVATSPEWLAVRAAMVGALAPFPEASRAVAAALAGLESGRVIEA